MTNQEGTDSPDAEGLDHSHSYHDRLLEPLVPLANASPVRIKVSWRWFGGTFITGVAGLALVGAALYASFNGRLTLAMTPAAPIAETTPFMLASVGQGKGDRVGSPSGGLSVRNVIHESQVRRVGSKEFVEVKPYVRLTASLSLSKSELTADLPAFNPLKLFAEDGEEEPTSQTDEATPETAGTIAVSQVAFNPDPALFELRRPLGNAEAQLQVLRAMELSGRIAYAIVGEAEVIDPASEGFSLDGSGEIDLATEASYDGDSGNISVLEKIETDAGGASLDEPGARADVAVVVDRGDTLSKIFTGAGATAQDANAMAAAMASVFPANGLKIGQEIRIALRPDVASGRTLPARVSLFEDGEHLVSIGLEEEGRYKLLDQSLALAAPGGDGATVVAQARAQARSQARTQARAQTRAQARAQLYDSLYETGRRNGIDDMILEQIIRINSYDVDLKRDVQAGDTFEVFFAEEAEGGETPDVLYTALTLRGETRRFYRFRTPDDGVVDYYDEQGRSAKKFLLRQPINGGVMRSRFGMRVHPITRVRKLHTGIDLAAPRGTPIVAGANGVIEKAQWSNGYGYYTRIRHANGYVTAYAHQQGFAKGIVAGRKVRQGEVIGYVGSTGLSTGPHVHYEVIVNGRFVDPMRIRVPRGRTLQGRMLAAFERERTRIDRLMNREPASTTRLASAAAR